MPLIDVLIRFFAGVIIGSFLGFVLGYEYCRRLISEIAKNKISKEQHADIFGYPLRENGTIKYSKYDKDTR
jgi:membrane protein DedA with SNARE-associated domain